MTHLMYTLIAAIGAVVVRVHCREATVRTEFAYMSNATLLYFFEASLAVGSHSV